MKILTFAFFLILSTQLLAQNSIVGKWKSIDDSSGEPKSIIELAERNGKVYGKIVRIFVKQGEDPDPVCNNCPKDDPRFDKKVIGMEIVAGLTPDGDAYTGGDILDPENGKTYRCKMWVENNTLKVRGYLGPFFRTQTWQKVTAAK